MSRFILAADARRDLEQIADYLATLPKVPANKIGRALQKMLADITRNPQFGIAHSNLTVLTGVEVRSRIVLRYRIYYL